MVDVSPAAGGTRITVEAELARELGDGDSVAVNGVCLTAVGPGNGRFVADLSSETVARSALASLTAGAPVNLELPLRPSDRLGGHIVQGHVDGVGRVAATTDDGAAREVRFDVPPDLMRYVVEKGSVAVDGVSLTVNAVRGAQFEVNVIPHTQAVTVIGEYARGTAVNIEVDMLARYLERLVEASAGDGIDLAFLRKHGYARDHR